MFLFMCVCLSVRACVRACVLVCLVPTQCAGCIWCEYNFHVEVVSMMVICFDNKK